MTSRSSNGRPRERHRDARRSLKGMGSLIACPAIARPGRGRPGKWEAIHRLLLKTMDTGGVVRLSLQGQHPQRVRNTVKGLFNRSGLSFHSVIENGHLKCWITEMDDRRMKEDL